MSAATAPAAAPSGGGNSTFRVSDGLVTHHGIIHTSQLLYQPATSALETNVAHDANDDFAIG